MVNSELSTKNEPQQLPHMVGPHGTFHIQLWELCPKMGVPDLRKTNWMIPPLNYTWDIATFDPLTEFEICSRGVPPGKWGSLLDLNLKPPLHHGRAVHRNHIRLRLYSVRVVDGHQPSHPRTIYSPSRGLNGTATVSWRPSYDHTGDTGGPVHVRTTSIPKWTIIIY